MTMHKTGSSVPPNGQNKTPWPSKVLVHRAEKGGFVPQPLVIDLPCMKCGGTQIKQADGKIMCQSQCEVRK